MSGIDFKIQCWEGENVSDGVQTKQDLPCVEIIETG